MLELINKKFNDQECYNTVILETDNFKVIPSLGSLVEGWLLIVPKRHYLSFGYLPQELIVEFDYLHTKVLELLQAKYGSKVIAFENGTLLENSPVGCGVDYAHMHYVPVDFDLRNLLSGYYNNELSWEEMSSFITLTAKINSKTSYIFIEDINRRRYICDINKPSSQLIRKLIANEIGLSSMYDWKIYGFHSNVIKTLNRILDTTSKYSLS